MVEVAGLSAWRLACHNLGHGNDIDLSWHRSGSAAFYCVVLVYKEAQQVTVIRKKPYPKSNYKSPFLKSTKKHLYKAFWKNVLYTDEVQMQKFI